MSDPVTKPRRNEACPCGSGRKYKHCCGRKPPQPAASRPRAAETARAQTLSSAEIIEFMSLSQAGRHADLERRAREQTQRHPGVGLPWKALTVALRMQGKDSLSAAQRAAELLPQDAEAQAHLAMALQDAGRPLEAVARYQQALRLKPEDLGTCIRLGRLLMELDRLEDAAACHQQALQINPDLPDVRYRLGVLCLGLGRYQAATAHFEHAIRLQPGNPALHAQLGTALRMLGRPAQAEAELRRALALDPNLADAWVGLSQLRLMTAADASWLESAQRALDASRHPAASIALIFAIGKYFDDIGEFERAFDAFRRANALARQHGRPFERAQLSGEVDRIITTFDARWLAEVRSALPAATGAAGPAAGAGAVIVVGMPRAGCSRLGWSLSTHPAIHTAGELRYWSDAYGYYNAAVQRGASPAALLQRLGADYGRSLQALAPDAQRVIDHMPGNFARLGLIHAALPGARIIHVRRDAIDTCFSIYSHDSGGALPFANDLEDLAHFAREYRRLMQHWQSLLPAESMLDIDAEQLVADAAAACRQVLDFLGLPWDERCLDGNRADAMPEHLRAETPGHWRHYARHLGPLLALSEGQDGGA